MSKNKKRKPINPIPKFAVGDIIRHPTYGVGSIKKISSDADYDFYYDADFTGKGGDGTKVWLPKRKTEKICELVDGFESIA